MIVLQRRGFCFILILLCLSFVSASSEDFLRSAVIDSSDLDVRMQRNILRIFPQDLCHICSSSADCGLAMHCINGCCKKLTEKDSDLYGDKEIFLISDSDWKEVLQFVPVTTWSGDESWCKKGYGLSDDVCVYPTLIYDSEEYKTYALFSINGNEFHQTSPSIYENKIVYEDNRNGNSDIYLYDLISETEVQITNDLNDQYFADIYENKIVYEDNRNGNSDIYIYDLDTNQEIQLTLNSEDQTLPKIYENKIVYEDNRNGNSDIYLYDLDTNQEIQLTTNSNMQISPDIYANRVVYSSNQNGMPDIFVYDLVTGQEIALIEEEKMQLFPSIHGDILAWQDYRGSNLDVYMYNFVTDEETLIGSGHLDQQTPIVGDAGIVWTEGSYGAHRVVYYDVQTGETQFITSDWSGVSSPSIYGDIIVWQDDLDGNQDVYFSNLEGFLVDSFDVDSVIYFMQQYSPNKVTLIGDYPSELVNLIVAPEDFGAGLSEEDIQLVSPKDYLMYWSSYESIVLVEDNYQSALLASTYASLINSPLVIGSSSANDFNIYVNKNVICVGEVSPGELPCNEEYSLEELEQRYLDLTGTDKLMLVNYNDENIFFDYEFSPFQPEKSLFPIEKTYRFNSLTAPILASAKKELLISTSSTDYLDVDNFLDNKIDSFSSDFEYLTLVASPNAIDMSYDPPVGGRKSTDVNFYSNVDSDFELELNAGRLFGVTLSDTSSMIARTLFYGETLKHPNEVYLTRGSPYASSASVIYSFGKIFEFLGYDVVVTPESNGANNWKDKFIINYLDHANQAGVQGMKSNQIPYLDNPFVLLSGCLTCAYELGYDRDNLFCANAIRKGAVGYIGSVDTAAPIGEYLMYYQMHLDNLNFAESFYKSINDVNRYYAPDVYYKNYLYMGDPTLDPEISKVELPSSELMYIDSTDNGDLFKLKTYFMRIVVPQEIRDLDDSPSYGDFSFSPSYLMQLSRPEFGFFDIFDFSYGEYSGIENVGWEFSHDESDGKILIRSAKEDYVSLAEENELTPLEFDLLFFRESPRKVFVTSGSWDGNFRGVQEADAKCQEAATNANLPGAYRAWISDSQTDVIDRLSHPRGKIVRLDGALVAKRWEDLVDGTIMNPININEYGKLISSSTGSVWTGTNIDGSSSLYTCDDWSNNEFGPYGVSGLIESTGGSWTIDDTLSCDNFAHFYCFEQNSSGVCVDSDSSGNYSSGINSNVYGFVIDVLGGSGQDYCLNENDLEEYYCNSEDLIESVQISCGLNEICTEGKCCSAKTCEELGYFCGSQNDGCGGIIDCGSCQDGYGCSSGNCVPLILDGISQITNSDPEIPGLNGPNSVFVSGNYTYTANADGNSLTIIDISDPTNPDGVAQITNSDPEISSMSFPWSVFVSGNYAYMINAGGDSLTIIDISDPTNPDGVGQVRRDDPEISSMFSPNSVFVSGNYAYVTSYWNSLAVIDISDPTNPDGIAQITNSDPEISLMVQPNHVFVSGNYAYVTSKAEDSLTIIDISDPTNPDGVAQITADDSEISSMFNPSAVFVSGNYAYTTNMLNIFTYSLAVIDISDPTNPDGIAQITNSDPEISSMLGPASVFVSGNYAYVAGAKGDSLAVIDISDPTNPDGIAQITSDDSDISTMDDPVSVFVSGNYAYVVAYEGDSLSIIHHNKGES